jgi:hypothetical protein
MMIYRATGPAEILDGFLAMMTAALDPVRAGARPLAPSRCRASSGRSAKGSLAPGVEAPVGTECENASFNTPYQKRYEILRASRG